MQHSKLKVSSGNISSRLRDETVQRAAGTMLCRGGDDFVAVGMAWISRFPRLGVVVWFFLISTLWAWLG